MSLFDPKTHDRPIEYTSDAHQSNVNTELDDVLMDLLTKNYQTKYDPELDIEVVVNVEEAVEKAKKDIQAIIDTKVREAEQKLLDWLEIDIYDETPDDVTNHELGEWIESRRKLLSTEEEGTK